MVKLCLQFRLSIFIFWLQRQQNCSPIKIRAKKMQFYCPFSSSYPGIFTYLLYFFSFYGVLSSFHHDIEAEEGVPPIVSWEFEQITWETRLTQHANFLQASQQNPFLENQLSIIHEGASFIEIQTLKEMIKYFILLFTITINSVLLFNYSNQQMSGSRNVLCIVLLF